MTSSAVAAEETASGRAMGSRVLPALDTMRAVGAIAVVATHASFWGGAYARPGYGTALARLDIGVAIFFVLSGFLLSRPWLARHHEGRIAPSATRYLWKRALRIVPVYAISVVAALLLLPDNDDASASQWLTTLTMTNLYFDDNLSAGLTQMWSLGTEVAFYLVLPLVMWVALSRRHGSLSRSRLGAVLALLVILNVVWLLDLAERLAPIAPLSDLWLPSYLNWFAVGIALAACFVTVHGPRPESALASTLQRMGGSPGICWTAGLALFAIAATPLAGPASLTPPSLGEALTKNLLYALIAGLLILPCLFADPAGNFMRFMSMPGMRHLGHISYGVFCIHLVIIELVARTREMPLFGGRTLELFAITMTISLLVSEALYRLVERPTMRLKDVRFPGNRRSVESSSPSAAATKS